MTDQPNQLAPPSPSWVGAAPPEDRPLLAAALARLTASHDPATRHRAAALVDAVADAMNAEGAPDSLHFGIVRADRQPMAHRDAEYALRALSPAGHAPDWRKHTGARLLPLAERPTFCNGSWAEWGEPHGAGHPLAVVVDLGEPATVDLLAEVRAHLCDRLGDTPRLAGHLHVLDYAVVTDTTDHGARVGTVGAWDLYLPPRV